MIASQNSINGTPTLFFYNKGRLVDKVVGAPQRSELVRRLDLLARQ
jgi:protein-disulfide isomerase